MQSGKKLFLRVSALEGGLTVGIGLFWFSLDLDYWLLFKGLGSCFSDLDISGLKGYGYRSLLIQRCKKHRRQGNFSGSRWHSASADVSVAGLGGGRGIG